MIRKIFSYVKEYKKETILTPIFVALEVIMEIIIPLFMADMIDNGITGGNMNALLKTSLTLLILCVLSLFFGVLSGRTAAKASAGISKNLRLGIFEKVQDFSFDNIDKFSSSSLVTRLTTDITNIQNAFQMIIRICARTPLMIIFSVIMVFRINKDLAWIFVGIIPLLSIGLIITMKMAMPVFSKVFKLYDKLNTVIQENLRGIRVVKSYVREDHEIDKFKSASKEIHDNYVIAEKILAFNSPLMQFCMYLSTLLVCWFGAQLIVGGSFTTGQLMSLLTYAIQILTSLMILSMVFVMVTMSRASGQRIVEVLDEEPGIKNSHNPVYTMENATITFNDVDFGYKGKDSELCLKNINIEIPQGSTVGILGGTGSGKSTFIQLIQRLYDTTSGSVNIGGIDVKDYDLDTLRKNVTIVLQKNTLFSGTIKDNLRWGNLNATEDEMIAACQLAQADSFIETFPDRYDTWIDQDGANVSGGQKQRLCIARAILRKPKVLILDDSTSAVDTKTDAMIRSAFKKDIPNTTKIIVAQRVSSIQDADHIIVMDDGKICAVGSHEELLEGSSIYKETYESQKKGGSDHDVA